jgi:hypothetical protein
VCYHPDSGLPVVLLPELLPSEVLADGAPFCPSYGLHCCFPPMVKRFRLSPLSVSGKFSVAEAPCYLSAVWLNLPKNTLQRLVFVGFRRCYPPGSGSGSSGKRVFTRAVWLASQLSFAFLSLTFSLPSLLPDDLSRRVALATPRSPSVAVFSRYSLLVAEPFLLRGVSL